MERSKARRPLKDQYLVAYNTISALLWLGVTGRTLILLPSVGPQNVYPRVGTFVKWTQTLAVLEIVHILFGLLRSSLSTTLLQVASRILLVWGICHPFQAPRYSLPYSTMILAWGITEVCRYSYYVTNILGKTPKFLTWLRYNTFYVLYPMGAGSEALCIYNALREAAGVHVGVYWFLVGVLLTYPPGMLFFEDRPVGLGLIRTVRVVQSVYAYDRTKEKEYPREEEAEMKGSISLESQWCLFPRLYRTDGVDAKRYRTRLEIAHSRMTYTQEYHKQQPRVTFQMVWGISMRKASYSHSTHKLVV